MTFALAHIPDRTSACGVYAIRRVGGGCYVGQSIDVYGRLRDHRKRLRRGDHRSALLQAAYNEAGENAFEVEILADSLNPQDRETLALVEQEFMDALCADLNVCPSSVSRAGAKMSARARANCSAGQAKRWTPEARAEQAERVRRYFDEHPEARERAANQLRKCQFSNKGKTFGQDMLSKLSASKTGVSIWGGKRKMSESHLEALRVAGEKRRGQPSPKKGKPGWSHSDETRGKMRASRLAYLEKQKTRAE